MNQADRFFERSSGRRHQRSIDLAAGVYYDIDTGTEITPYIGVGGGMSQVSVKVTKRAGTSSDKLGVGALLPGGRRIG